MGFPGGSEVKASACNAGDLGSIPGLGRSPGEGNGNPLHYSCRESLVGYSSWGCKESDTTERFHFHETLGWRKHKLESRLPGEISITSDMRMTPALWQKMKN